MADTAPMTVYRREWVKVFEQRNALLRDTCITEGMIAGNQVVFPLGGSGGASATTRGMNGRIPARKNNVQQITAPLVEAHDKVEQTRFNFFTAQADMRQLFDEWYHAIVSSRDGRRQAEHLRGKLLEVI